MTINASPLDFRGELTNRVSRRSGMESTGTLVEADVNRVFFQLQNRSFSTLTIQPEEGATSSGGFFVNTNTASIPITFRDFGLLAGAKWLWAGGGFGHDFWIIETLFQPFEVQ